MFLSCPVTIQNTHFSGQIFLLLRNTATSTNWQRCTGMVEDYEEERDVWFSIFSSIPLLTVLPFLLLFHHVNLRKYLELSTNFLNSSHKCFHSRKTHFIFVLQNNLKYWIISYPCFKHQMVPLNCFARNPAWHPYALCQECSRHRCHLIPIKHME